MEFEARFYPARRQARAGIVTFTESQLAAIHARGNVLVSAGAGAGKTSTLVEACLNRLLNVDKPAGIDEILMVTFTEAAAAEMKERIRNRLMSALNQSGDKDLQDRLDEQIALLDTAPIGTLHAFCLRLIHEHFHELGIDPQVEVLSSEQSAILMRETFDAIIENYAASDTRAGKAVQDLIEVQARGRDETLRDLIFRIHRYTQTRANPREWFQGQLRQFSSPVPSQWSDWLASAAMEWRDIWMPALIQSPPENFVIRACADLLSNLPASPSRERIAAALAEVIALDTTVSWKGTKGRFRGPFKEFFDDARFLSSLSAGSSSGGPLDEDWNWVRGQMDTLLRLGQEFGIALSKAKREQGVLDFHDLEQFTLQLLWDPEKEQPTPIAEQLRDRFKHLFVDEYQDINPAQDKILLAISGGEGTGNRFLVGDVKQSVYRFRLADPRIFQDYRKAWACPDHDSRVISLSENFRSREALLQFINPLFSNLMREEVGGVSYESADVLQFGAPDRRRPLAHTGHGEPCVEFHVHLGKKAFGGRDTEERDSELGNDQSFAEPSQTEKEARFVAQRLLQLISSGHQVWDSEAEAFRNLRWGDVAILLRALKNKSDIYAKVFQRMGVPLQVPQSDFFDAIEVSDLICLLQLLDNPLRDLPLLAVLRSPLVGLKLDDLVEIRVFDRRADFWDALKGWHKREQAVQNKQTSESSPAEARESGESAFRRVDRFLERFHRWRSMAREASVSQRLEAILDETHYEQWLLSQPLGVKRVMNVWKLHSLAREFDPLQRCGLQRFLQSVEAQRDFEVDIEPSGSGLIDAVALTTIHKSKGLEYPVVVAADLGKRFNFRDLTGEIILDEEFGLCPLVKPPFTGRSYPSLPNWLARKRQRREVLGEELRLLYVAMTRARDTLILVGTAPETTVSTKWSEETPEAPIERRIASANSVLDWLGPWIVRAIGSSAWPHTGSGKTACLRWHIHESQASDSDEFFPEDGSPPNLPTRKEISLPDSKCLQEVMRRLEWRYPFEFASREPAKSAVTTISKRFAPESEEARLLFPEQSQLGKGKPKSGTLSGADVGTAHHMFLQLVSFDEVETASSLRNEAARLQRIGALSAEAAESLDIEALRSFWQSDPGKKILTHQDRVHREIPFTARFLFKELNGLLGGMNERRAPPESSPQIEAADARDDLENEFVLVQGVVDLAVILDCEIWLLDYKTDAVTIETVGEKIEKYKNQLRLYSLALERIYRKPVTSAWLHFFSIRRTVELTFGQEVGVREIV